MFLSSHRETTFTVRIIMTGCFFGCRVIIRIKKRIICLNKRKEQRKRVKNEMRKIATLCMMNAQILTQIILVTYHIELSLDDTHT